MAGLGFKDFSVGEVLTSADVDGYLMQQSVMRFADSAARGWALGTATGAGTALAEGMVAYLDDENGLQVYDGAVWRPVGSVLQVVTATDTTDRSTSSGTLVDASISVSVTPVSATSTLVVEWSGRCINATTSSATAGFQLAITDSSNVGLAGAEDVSWVVTDTMLINVDLGAGFLVRGLVASTDTSARTYKGRFARATNDSATLSNATTTGRMLVWEVEL